MVFCARVHFPNVNDGYIGKVAYEFVEADHIACGRLDDVADMKLHGVELRRAGLD